MAKSCFHAIEIPRSFKVNRSNPHRLFMCSEPPPTAIARSSEQSYWDTIGAQIEAHLKQSIPIRPPLVVYEPMHHLAFAAPKNTAAALCIAACELVGGERDHAMAAASALHLMHASTYVHEHLPLTDRLSITRPITCHAFAPNIELLTGDGLVPFGFELLSASACSSEEKAAQILGVIVEIARVMGSQGIIEGQYVKSLHIQSINGETSGVIKKTNGALHACGAACGAMLGGGSQEEIEKLRKYGLYAGIIQGVLGGGEVDIRDKSVTKMVDELREMALNELRGFDQVKAKTIFSLVHL